MRGTHTDRGVAPALTYVLAIGMVTLLISGLLVATTSFVEGEREGVVRQELEILGERLAANAVAVDRAGADGANVSQRTTVPATVADAGYYVEVVTCSAGSACLELRSADPRLDVSVIVPMNTGSTVSFRRVTPRTIRIVGTERGGAPPTADADVRIAPDIGIAEGVDPSGGETSGVFEAGTAPVVSGFSFSPDRPNAGETVTFGSDVRKFDEDVDYTYRWDFDEDGVAEVTGNESTAGTTTHTFSTPGRYSVELEVEGGNNQTDSVTRLVRASGLELVPGSTSDWDADGDGDRAGIAFDLRNTFPSEDATVTDVRIDPQDPDIDEVDNDAGDQIRIDGTGLYDDDAAIYDNGTIVTLNRTETVGSGAEETVEIGEFRVGGDQTPTFGLTFEIAVRYETSGRRNYVSTYTIAPGAAPGPGDDPPKIDDVTDTSQCTSGAPASEEFRVTVEADDPNDDLDRVVVEAFENSGGSSAIDKDGGEIDATGDTEKFRFDGGNIDPTDVDYVEVTAYDDAGRTTSNTYGGSGYGCN